MDFKQYTFKVTAPVANTVLVMNTFKFEQQNRL